MSPYSEQLKEQRGSVSGHALLSLFAVHSLTDAQKSAQLSHCGGNEHDPSVIAVSL